MELKLYDVSMASGNPTSLTGTLTAQGTGGGSLLIGTSTTPMLPYPTVEPIDRVVADCNSQTTNSAAVPATQMLVQLFPTAAPFNLGGAQYGKVSANQQPVGRFQAGVVLAPPVSFAGPNGALQTNVPGGQSLIRVSGVALASVTTSAGRTPGQLLTLGLANNNLVDVVATGPGQVVATLLQTIAGAGTANYLVQVGGY